MTADPSPEFDAFAEDYDAALKRGISVSGESKDFFARGRLAWLKLQLEALAFQPKSIMDYGCGTGTATPFIRELLKPTRLLGVDISERSLVVARRDHGGADRDFKLFGAYEPDATFDLVFCNGVFHHIPIDQRASCMAYIVRSLRPGGLFALWENNPWNPGTQLVMARIPFDRDAVKLSPPYARNMIRNSGLGVVSTTFQFVFPNILSGLRRWEPALAHWPLGAQYQVLAQKSL